MGEEVRNTGNRAEDRLISLLQEFGWEYIGGGTDIKCASQKHDRDQHGIDGYMSYQDPYLSDERGVVVESKSRQWDSWGPSSLESAAKQVRTALECSTRSEDFDEKLNNHESRRRDTAVLGAFTNDGSYDHETFQSYVESCNVKRGGGPTHVLILGNRELSRLASIQSKYKEIKQRHTEGSEIVDADLNFYYPSLQEPRAAPTRRDTVSFEYLFSDYVYAKLQKTEFNGNDTETTEATIVFNSAGVDHDSLEFLYYSLRDNDGLDTNEVWVYSYLPNGNENVDETYNSAVDSVNRILPESKEFQFSELPQVDYKSYTQDLIEEET